MLSITNQSQGHFERGQRHLVDAQGSHQGIGLDPADGLLLAGHDAALRPTQQLVTGEKHQVGAGGHRLGDVRLARDDWGHARGQGTRSDIVDHPEAMGLGKLRQVLERRFLGEADDPEVAVMNSQDRRGFWTDHSLVVG